MHQETLVKIKETHYRARLGKIKKYILSTKIGAKPKTIENKIENNFEKKKEKQQQTARVILNEVVMNLCLQSHISVNPCYGFFFASRNFVTHKDIVQLKAHLHDTKIG